MNPAIGRLALTPMQVKTVDVEAVFRDFRECPNTFDDWASSFWSFSALDVEQVFKVGDEVALVAPINRSLYPSSTVATCQANGTLTLVHMFQSTRFVPIGNTPVMLQRIDPNGGPLGEPIHKTSARAAFSKSASVSATSTTGSASIPMFPRITSRRCMRLIRQ